MTTYTLTNPTTARMTFSIEEAFAEQHQQHYYPWIVFENCPVCEGEMMYVYDEDPGSVEAAIGVHHICDHPTCQEIAGGEAIICGTDIEELLRMSTEDLQEMHSIVHCDGVQVDISGILERRQAVDMEREQVIDPMMFDRYDDAHDDVDLDTEKWNNYWSDYNQCGVHVSWN